MKTLTSVAIISIVSVLSFNAMAGSKVKQSIVLNKSVNAGNATLAIGKNNLASTGSIQIKNARIIKSVVISRSVNKANASVAIGMDNTATTGSVAIR